MNYQDALNYLYDPDRVKGERSIKAGPGRSLEPMARVLAEVGSPQTRYKALHVAGSKGKGSTAAMLASILRAAGYRVGLFSSPHLHTYRERMQINDELPSEGQIVDLLTRLKPTFDTMPELITFELSTTMAFTYFAEQRVDLAVMEVGLGGRLDSTNVITPEVSVITALNLEHTAILGSTIPQIAFEKAGIIKPGIPVVVAPNPTPALAVVHEAALERSAPLVQVGEDVIYRVRELHADGLDFEARIVNPNHAAWGSRRHSGPPEPWRNYHLPLLGAYQAANATSALSAIDVVRGRGIPVPTAALNAGLRQVRWPARLEVLGRQPLVVADGAHTPESAALVIEAMRQHFRFEQLILVFGALQDKDVAGMLRSLLPATDEIIVARTRYPRSLSAAELVAAVRAQGREPTAALDDIPDALAAALARAAPGDAILATGSLFVAAGAREGWARLKGLPPPPGDPPLH